MRLGVMWVFSLFWVGGEDVGWFGGGFGSRFWG